VTLPIPSNVFTDTQLIDEALLYANVFVPINTIYAQLQQQGGFLYGETEGTSGNTVTLATLAATALVPNAAVTFTLATTRRVRIRAQARYSMASGASGACSVTAAYVAGGTATLTGVVLLGQSNANQVSTTTTGGAGSIACAADHTVLLTAGQWTAFPVAVRTAGGSATDTALLGLTAVYDAGNT